MKKLLMVMAAVATLAACNNADQQSTTSNTPGGDTANNLSDEKRREALMDSSKYTTIEWLDSTHRNLGKVNEGEKVEVNFRFRNTGKHPLIIDNVSASCGCTTPNWPRKPIAPGEEETIKAVFDSKYRMGMNRKDVTITANTLPNNNMIVSFEVEVTKSN